MATVVFIHGYGKTAQDWNVTDRGRRISIEEQVSERCSTILVQLEETDYRESTLAVAIEMCAHLEQLIAANDRVIVVAHSFGAFYAMHLANRNPRRFLALLLLDPTLKTNAYRQQLDRLASDEEESIANAKLRHFDELPTAVPNSVVVRVHFNYKRDMTSEAVARLHDLTKINVKSRCCLHVEASHMIHYKLPQVVVDAVFELVTTVRKGR